MALLDPTKSNVVPFAFLVADASGQSQSATAMSAAGEATAGDVPQQPCPWAGSIVGFSVQVEAARQGGILTVQPSINGTAAAATLTVDDDPTQYNSTSWRRDRYPITAGQRIGCLWSSDASWDGGTTPTVRCVVFVHIGDPK